MQCLKISRQVPRFRAWTLIALCGPSVLACAVDRTFAQAGSPPGEVRTPRAQPDRQTVRSVSLAPKYVAGRTTRYAFEIDSASKYVSTTDPDLNQDQTHKERITFRLTVKEASAAGATLELAYERVVLSLKTPDVDMTVDSSTPATSPVQPGTKSQPGTKNQPGKRAPSKPAKTQKPAQPASSPPPAHNADPLAQFADISLEDIVRTHVKSVAGTVLTIKTDGAGNLVSVTGGDTLGGGIPGLGGMGGMGAGGLPGLGTPPGALANWVAGGGLGQPAEVRVGQTWTTDSALAGTPIGGIGLGTSYTLASLTGDTARITFRGSAGPGSAANALHAGAGVRLSEALYSGECDWDARSGEIASLRAQTQVSLQSNAAGIGATMTSSQKIRVSRLR